VIKDMAAATIPATWLYSFFHSFGVKFIASDALKNGVINTHFIGMNLLGSKNIVLTILAAIFTYFQTKLTTIAKPATPDIP